MTEQISVSWHQHSEQPFECSGPDFRQYQEAMECFGPVCVGRIMMRTGSSGLPDLEIPSIIIGATKTGETGFSKTRIGR